MRVEFDGPRVIGEPLLHLAGHAVGVAAHGVRHGTFRGQTDEFRKRGNRLCHVVLLQVQAPQTMMQQRVVRMACQERFHFFDGGGLQCLGDRLSFGCRLFRPFTGLRLARRVSRHTAPPPLGIPAPDSRPQRRGRGAPIDSAVLFASQHSTDFHQEIIEFSRLVEVLRERKIEFRVPAGTSGDHLPSCESDGTLDHQRSW